MTARHWRGVAWLGLTVVLIGTLAWQALRAPAFEFLRPSLRGTWLVHAQPPVEFQGHVPTPSARFARRLTLATVPPTVPVQITAMRSFVLEVNGRELSTPPPGNWKRAVAYDLAAALHPDDNEIVVTVRNLQGPPALLVEGPAAVRTGPGWTVALGPSFAAAEPAAVPDVSERFRQGRAHPLRGTRAWPWCVAAATIYLGFLVFVAVPNPRRLGRSLALPTATGPAPVPGGRGSRRAETQTPPPWWRRHGVGLAIVLAVGVVHFHDARVYPHTRSPFDVGGHVDYIRHVAKTWQVPTARDGWEMYQPPLYYFAAAGVYRLAGGPAAEPRSLKAVQYFSAAAGWAGLWAGWWLLTLLVPDRPGVRQLGLAVTAMLPMTIYLNPMITNEVFAATIITLASAVAAWTLTRPRAGPVTMAGAGLVAGLALLAKYTGLFVGIALLAARLLGADRLRRAAAGATVALAAILLVAGWVYVRNARLFGNPFIGNWDEASGFHYEQLPGYRTAGFYARFGRVLIEPVAGSAFTSFWDGLYGSAWGDGHGAFLPWNNPRPVLGSLIFWLALWPTRAIVTGFARAVRALVRGEANQAWLVIVLATVLTVAALISFTMEVPFYSTVKGFFLLSLAAPAGAFAALGWEPMQRRLGRAHWLIPVHLAVLAGLVGWLFWY